MLAAPLILAGTVLARHRGIGRALTGAGLMLLSVTLLGQAAEPLRSSPLLAGFLPLLDSAWPVALMFAAGLAVLCSSSLAAVLLIGSLGLPHDLTAVLVLGANVGGALPAVLAGWPLGAAARRVTVGNLVVRTAGALMALALVGPAAEKLAAAIVLPMSFAVEVHVAFNLVLALIAWPFARPMAEWLARRLPEPPPAAEDAGPRWLDEAVLQTPVMALAGARREALVLGDMVEQMLDLIPPRFQRQRRCSTAPDGRDRGARRPPPA